MNIRATTLHRSNFFELLKKKRRKSDKVYFEVRMTGWIPLEAEEMDSHWSDDVRDMIDPERNKSGKEGRHWKFRNLKDAEQIYTALVLRWS